MGLWGHTTPESPLPHWSSVHRGSGAGADVLISGSLSLIFAWLSPAKLPSVLLSPRTSVTCQEGSRVQGPIPLHAQTSDKREVISKPSLTLQSDGPLHVI